MKKPADTSVTINPVLAERWSPRSFEPDFQIQDSDVTAILEAARWSPSTNNSQPWKFIVARKNSPEFETISKTLSGFNAVWAPNAALFILVATQTTNADGTARPLALYDAGIASANASTEAHHRGLAVHQIAGFDHDAIVEKFNFGIGLRPLAILVIGKQAPADKLNEQALRDRENAKRERLSLTELVLNNSAHRF
jgi:nitroreductase